MFLRHGQRTDPPLPPTSIVPSHPGLGSSIISYMQQASESHTAFTTIIMDTSAAPAVTSAPPSFASEAPVAPQQGMTFATKIGLGMIPVVVFLCGVWIFFLFWWRRRRAHKALGGRNPPPVPEKDFPSVTQSFNSSRRGSKVFNMAAFSTPIHDGRYREAKVLGQSKGFEQTNGPNQREKRQINATIARLANSETTEVEQDSPIDSKSPFRLKRGDTVKRCSLGTEISSLWPSPSPSPPPSAWVKRPSVTERLHSPPLTRANSFSRPRPRPSPLVGIL